jgi:hypothetical protein
MSVPPLTAPELHALNAALGWLGLGLFVDAQQELNSLSLPAQTHPRVLDVQFAIYGETGAWEAAFAVAETEVKLQPGRSGGWVHRAFAARRRPQGSLEEAFRLLRPAFDQFPNQVVIPYNLACYRAQQAQMEEAWQWFAAALERGQLAPLKEMALQDNDLKALWPRIAALK